jgi:hypothetical protein
MTPDWIKAALAGSSGAMTMTIFLDVFGTPARWEIGLLGLVILLGLAHILDITEDDQ